MRTSLGVGLLVLFVVACAEDDPARHLDGGMADARVTDAYVADAPYLTVAATAGTGGTVATSEVTGGSCSGTSCTLANGASTVTFTPTPDANYRFGAWSGTTCVDHSDAGNAITYTNPTSDHTCDASFIATVAIDAIAASGGSIAASGLTGGTCTGTSCTIDAGAGTVTFTPTPSANHQFTGWSGCTGYTQSGNAITFTNPTSAKTCAASFGATVAVSATAGTGGSVAASNVSGGSCSGTSCILDSGAGSVTFTATPNANYRFGSWSGCTGFTGTGAAITFTNPTTAKDCTANFVATVVVSATAGTGGTVAASGLTGASCTGTTCALDAGASTVTFTPNITSGYRFGGWSGATCTGYTQAGNAITFTNPTTAKSCVASFVAVVSVTATAGTGGTVAASAITGGSCTGTNCTLDSGASSVTFTATAGTNFRFGGWSGCSTSTNPVLTITNPTTTTTCAASFVATVSVTATAGTGGTVAASGITGGSCTGTNCTLDSGASTVTFTATAGTNYRFGGWSGCSTSTNPVLTITNPTTARSCTASFVATVNVTATAGTGGSVGASNISGGTCTGTNCTLDSGAGSVTFTATPSSGFRFSSWSGCSTSTNASIAVTNRTTSTTCTANFVATVNVSANASGPGGVSASNLSGGTCAGTNCTLDNGASSVTFTATATGSSRFSGWSGCSASTSSSITITNPTTSTTCTANFVATVSISANATSGGNVFASNISGGTCSGTACTLDAGASSVTFTASATGSSRFTGWSGCSTSTSASITITNPTTSTTCTANFVATIVVTANSTTGGNVFASNVSGGSCSGTTCTLDAGASSVTFTAAPFTGYRFSNWSNCSSSTSASIAVTNAPSSVTCTANFVAVVTVTANAATGGSVAVTNLSAGSCSGTTCTFDAGTGSVTFTATPSSGFRFDAWSGCTTGTGTSVSIANPTTSTTCTANFVATVKVSAVPMPAAGGSVGVSGLSNADCAFSDCTLDKGNSGVTFTPLPASGFRFAGWSGCTGYFQGQGSSIFFVNPTTDIQCTATFVATVNIAANVQGTGSITVSNVSGGSCSGANCTMDAGNSQVTFTPVPGPNSQFIMWSGCSGYLQGQGASIIFVNPTSSQTCTAVMTF